MGQSRYEFRESDGELIRNVGLGCAVGGAALAAVGIVSFRNAGRQRRTVVPDTSTPGGVMAGARFNF